jgi:hypothetical protein
VANNTYLTWEYVDETFGEFDRPRAFGVRLHRTIVVTFHENGTIELDTGGWKTPTTKARMNDALAGYEIFSDRSVWYIAEWKNWNERRILPIPTKCLKMRKKARGRREFEDGMILHPAGLWHDEEMKYNG